MPTLLHFLSYVASAGAVVFVTLSLASGLLWLAELIEENTKTAKTIGMRICYSVIALHVALWYFDNLPPKLIAFGILCHIVYLQNFSSTWPVISLTSWSFLASIVLVVTDHFFWFFHFAHVSQKSRRGGGHARPPYHNNPHLQNHATFTEISAFFGLCVWIIPLFLFLSLSANDNALPTSKVEPSPSRPDFQIDSKFGKKLPPIATQPRQSLFKTIFDPVFDLLAVLRLRRARKTQDGLIAPPTPNRSSPMLTPRPITPTGLMSPSTPNPFTPTTDTYVSVSPDWRTPATRLSRPPPPRRVTIDNSPRSDGRSLSPGGIAGGYSGGVTEPTSVRKREAGGQRNDGMETIGLGLNMRSRTPNGVRDAT